MRTTRQKFNLILTLAAMLTMAQTAWATDPVTKTYAFSTRSLENNNSTLKMTDPDDNTSKTIITSASNYKFSNYGSELRVGAGGQYTIYPNVNGKVTRVEFTRMGRWGSPYYPDPSQPVFYIGAFSMSITGMTCNGKNSLTGNGTSVGEGLSAYTNEDASFTFVSTDAAGIEGSLSMTLGDYALMLIRSGCELKITYIPSVAPVHAHDFTYILDGNTLTATCGGTDGLACSLTNHQISTSLTADDAFDSDPAMSFPATLSNYAPFSTETGATKGNITYVNNTTSENLGTTMPSDPGQYTASITVTAGGTGYTLTKTYNVYSYAQINNIYPQLNISTEKYASTTMAGEGQTVTITFTPKFGETLTSLTVTGATTNYSIGSGITDNGSNTYTFTMPAENVTIGATYDVTLSGRTLYKDGAWNTLCLPFDVTLEGSPLEGAVAKTLDLTNTVMSGTNVHIAFGEPVEVLTAGVPYIIKWESGNSIANPTFEDVAITAPTAQVLTSTDECTRFIGYYDAFDIDASDTDIFYMTADNTLKYTAKPRTLKACRAYFQFSANGGSDVKALTFDMDFGDGDATGIELVESGELRDECEIYDLAGRRISTPTKGLYIINGKKVFVK